MGQSHFTNCIGCKGKIV
uniref:Uncharacterized protein n=1 Tax=Arundo donax TaxID=35708 RepID=A0A0A9AC22_ARUDO